MSIAIVPFSSSLASGVMTLVFRVADAGPSVESFQLEFAFDPLKVSNTSASGPAGWTTLAGRETGSLSVGSIPGVDENGELLPPVAAGSTLLTVRLTLSNPADTSVSVNYSGTYNPFQQGTVTMPLNGLILSNGSFVQNAPAMGMPQITGTPTEDQTLTADASGITDGDGLGPFSFQWLRDGTPIGSATASTYKLGDADAGKNISVQVSYKDGKGNNESVLSAAKTVANVNDAPVGAVTITGVPATGAPAKGLTLSASHGLTDADGLGTISWQWLAGGTPITNATAQTFVLTDAEVGKQVSVRASYKDGQGTSEAVMSAPTATVVVNNAPTGGVSIDNLSPSQGQTLTTVSTLADPDGLGPLAYQWFADGSPITGATAATFKLEQAQVGKAISVTASYQDLLGNKESKTAAATGKVANVNDPPGGSLTIQGTARQGEMLSVKDAITDLDGLGARTYEWFADGQSFASGATATLAQAQVGKTVTVTASYIDGFDRPETVQASTGKVENVNDAPQGKVTLHPAPVLQGQTVTADASAVKDPDGLGSFSYQWLAGGQAIGGATAGTFKTTQDQVGKELTVQVSYTDGQGTKEVVSASAGTVQNVNDAPGGTLKVLGVTSVNQVLTAENKITDIDGLPATFQYQWYAGDQAIAAATGSTFKLTTAELNKSVSVKVTYLDGGGTTETVASTAVGPVILNNPATGSVTVTGKAEEDSTLTAAASNVQDADGTPPGPFNTFEWRADGEVIAGQTGSSLKLGQAQVGKAITATAVFKDGVGTPETLTSAATAKVANLNDLPTGTLTIGGTVKQGQVLKANANLADEDGLGTFMYQWLANDATVTGATQDTFTPTQNEVGKALKVRVTYVDGQKTTETVTSAATVSVANENDPPGGSLKITGNAVQNETLTLADAITDLDGLTARTYQWLADGQAIAGATGTTLKLAQAQVGKLVTVKATYQDGFGTTENVTSDPTTKVANVNDAPTGTITINGADKATQGQTLTTTSTIADIDGLGTFTYEWLADNVPIANEVGSSLVLRQAQVGKAITVKVSYTDGQGSKETVPSAPTIKVINSNDPPTGSVTVAGDYTQGQTLTASNTLQDADGPQTLTVSYQWLANGSAIANATGSTYKLTQNEVGKVVTVRASYQDAGGTSENVTSAAPAQSVGNINDAPTGAVTITGGSTAKQGVLLVANTSTIADADGLGTFSYLWMADGTPITGATASTFTPGQDQVNKALTVKVSYRDKFDFPESLTSAASAKVENVNDEPTGTVTIEGLAQEDQVLTAKSTLADLDGLGPITFQWLSNGQAIQGATGATFTLTDQALVGKQISVRASYVDGFKNPESRTSAATAAVKNVNDPATGQPMILGLLVDRAVQQYDKLSVDTTKIQDIDGLGTFRFQWLADGQTINGATASTITLGQDQVGKKVSVRVNFTDQQGTPEQVVSDQTVTVANVNDAPTGTVTLDGAKVTGMPLTVNLRLKDPTGLRDLDGLPDATKEGSFKYEWFANNVLIGAAGNKATYTPVAADGGKDITVKVTYTDLYNVTETVTTTRITMAREDDVPSVPTSTGKVVAGDGNGDGIPDSQQVAVVSAPVTKVNSTEQVFVTLVAQSTAGQATESKALIETINQERPPEVKPAKLDMPLGLIDFTAVLAPGRKIETFSLFVSKNLNVNGYWKKDPTDGIWVNLASAPFGGSITDVGDKLRLDFKIEDGSKFDADGVVNGRIVDPGAMGALPLSIVGYAPDLVLNAATHFFF